MCAFAVFVMFSYAWQVNSLERDLAKSLQVHSEYVADAERKQAEAVALKHDIELHNFRNSERIAYEQQKRESSLAAELARLRGGEQRVRDELKAFRTATARNAKSGNTAALAANAAIATELYQACGIEYRDMAKEAERVRVQAVGMWDYIRGNSMCSTPFGGAVPEPAK
jgi:hypothetical protein